MAAPPIIRVRNLVAEFDSLRILEGVSLDVPRGSIFAVLGGSGSGKSTLLRHVLRLLRPAEGTIEVDGRDITEAEGEELQETRRKMGVLFQSGALFGSMTLAENVGLPLREYTRLPEELIRRVIRYKLALVGLEGYEEAMPAELSGGMQKRAALARAMALDPEILLFDEMSAGLDPVTSAGLDRLVLELNRSLGVTVVVVTHELPSVRAIADRAVLLHQGQILAAGTPSELERSELAPVRAFFHRQAPEVGGAGGGGWIEGLTGGESPGGE